MMKVYITSTSLEHCETKVFLVQLHRVEIDIKGNVKSLNTYKAGALHEIIILRMH